MKLMLDFVYLKQNVYNMDVVKEFKGTDSFLNMKESKRGCQIEEAQKVYFLSFKNCCYFSSGMFIKNLPRRDIKEV